MKVLITADIHIDDYTNYNYSYQSRLLQFDKLADRFIELAKIHNCKELWILGDLIDKPGCRPYVLHKAQAFLNKLTNHFETVRYILGNHDVNSKAKTLSSVDSLVTVLEYPNLLYMDHQILKDDLGHKFGFMNWRPEQDLTWLGEEHLDVLFGHYTKSDLFGQEIDETKFDLMIHGDIHNSQVIGKFVSVCNPLQKDMSSEAEGKVIVFETDDLKWERILVDPDHTRFLQLSYTDDLSLQGFHGPLQYNIYKPNIIDNSDETVQDNFDWSDINDLVHQTCTSYGLEDIHSEIESKCTSLDEIDFSFQLTYLKIHGYRSIEDLELNFCRGDRIALLGENGSGKSSIINALQGVFLKNSDLKYEQSDFTEDMDIEVKLIYQDKEYHIVKGTTWGLFIDGVEQSYSGVRDFESDLPKRLPFLNYLDLFFLSSNVSSLSEQFDQGRRIELISKFYRLDRLKAFHSTAINIWNELNSELSQIRSERDKVCAVLDHTKSLLTDLGEYKDKDIEEFKSQLKHYSDLRDKNHQYALWKTNYDNAKSQQSQLNSDLDSVNKKLSLDIEQAKIDLEDLKSQSTKCSELYESSYQDSIQFEADLKKFKEIESKGKDYTTKLNELKTGICPECGSTLDKGKSKELADKYQSELDELGRQWDELYNKLSNYPEKENSKDYYFKLLTKLKSTHKQLTDSIELLSNKISNYDTYKSNKVDIETKLSNINNKIKDLEDNKPEDVSSQLTGIDQLELDTSMKIHKCEEYSKLSNEYNEISDKIKDLDKTISDKTTILDRYNQYQELMANTGIIMEKILTRLADKFSSPDVKYEVESGVYRGSRFINFDSYYLCRGKFRKYWSCSAGQKTVCDLDFLDKLFSVNIGVLVLDEYLKHLDDNNFSRVCDTLINMNVNTIILCTHDDNLTAYTRRLLLTLDNVGKTIVSIV